MIKDLFLAFLPFITIGQIRTDRKLSGREIGRCDQERSSSQDSNSGCPYHNSAVCRQTAHKAIGSDRLSETDVTCAAGELGHSET